MCGRVLIACLLLAVPRAADLLAQDASQVSKGTRVRVTGVSDRGRSLPPVVGTLGRLVNDTIQVLVDSMDSRVIGLGPGSKLEVSEGSRGHGGIGAVAGGLFGIVIASQVWESCGGCSGGAPAGVVLIDGALGALVGAALGGAIRSERWVVVETAGIRIVAAPAGLGLRLSH